MLINSFSISLSKFRCRVIGSPKKQAIGKFGRVLCGGNSTAAKYKQAVREYHEVTGDIICPSMVQGIDHLRDPRLNKVHEIR